MAQEYLPAPSNVRLADLMKEHNISQPELAKKLGCSKSTISRFISGAKGTLTHEQVLKIARLFNVSTDFLLGETNIPDRKNYDIAELGLSVEAAKNLYTGRVNAEVVNLLLENARFAELTYRIAQYFDDTFASGIAAQNAMFTTLSTLLRTKVKTPEAAKAAKDISLRRKPVYQGDLDDIEMYFMAAVKELAQVPSSVMPGAYASFLGPDPANLFGVVILTSLGTWGLPQMIQKFYAIKDEKAVHTGTIISTLFAIVVSGGCYFLGGFSRISGVKEAVDGTVKYDTIIPTMLSSLPDILIGIVIVLVLSASMSTLSSLVLTSSSTLTLDFIKPLFVKKMNEKQQLVWMRVLLAGFILISVVIALDPPAFIAQLMGISWGALAGAFLAPFLYGLYWKGVTRAAVWASFICGVGITVANMFFRFIASPINAGAFAMVAGLVIVPVVSLISPKLKKETVEDVFHCLEEKVMVEQKLALPEEEE